MDGIKENEISVTYKNRFPLKLLNKLYLNADTADVYFNVKSNQTGQFELIPAHKVILIAVDPVFEAMLCGALKETGPINITDASAEAFKEFLQVLYLGKVKLTAEHFTEVLNLATKYNLDDCARRCSDCITTILTIDDMCRGYEIGLFLEQKNLVEFCEENIRIHPIEIFQSETFLNCNWSTLKRILNIQLLCSEFEVFCALLKWSVASCIRNDLNPNLKKNLRDQLKELMFQVDYRKIPTNIFKENRHLFDSLFYKNEILKLVIMIDDSKDIKLKPFDQVSRALQSFDWNDNDVLICKRLCQIYLSHYSMSKIQRTIFTSNRPILWRKFICGSLPPHSTRSISVKITIIEHAEQTFFINLKPNNLFTTQATLNVFDNVQIEMTETIVVKPNYKYEIKIEAMENKEICSHYGFVREIDLDKMHKIQFHFDSNFKYDNPTRGIITVLHFNRLPN